MAKVITTELQHSGASGANITLDSSKNVTCENNLQVDGNVTVTGTLPADKLTGNLPAISGASLTGITSQDTLSFRNLIINGGMNVAQRNYGGSSTSTGYQTVDRFKLETNGVDEAITQAKHALTSSDTGPWAKGFRSSYHLTNGNQTGGAGATDMANINYKIEAQDIANSGWDYTSASGKITLSFWAISSVAQTFQITLFAEDATYGYTTEFALSANTWTKVTKTIPGHASLAFTNNNDEGLNIIWYQFIGTDYTDSGATTDAWGTWNGGTTRKDMTSTWWTTNDATFELTGVQLEVGDTATEFEHRTFADELRRCQRYYYYINGDTDDYISTSFAQSSSNMFSIVTHPVPMRYKPTFTGNAVALRHYSDNSSANFNADQLAISHQHVNWYWGLGTFNSVLYESTSSMTGGQAGLLQCQGDGVKLEFDAEL